MVRPRGGSFVYTPDELEQIWRDLDLMKTLGADVLVFGILKDDGSIDRDRSREFVARAGSTPVTMHLAFDKVPDLLATLDFLMEASKDYSFNKAHAACYALIAYRTAWLKANHPCEYMRESGGGAIVNLSSVGGLIGLARRPAYTAAKHGVVGLTKSLARDLGPAGIRVNAICPGLIRTPLTEQYFADDAFEEGIRTVVPLQQKGADSELVTQFSMKNVEALGLLKVDFLGLRNLDVIDKAVALIGGGLDIGTIPLDDRKTYEMLARADATGVFQFESSGMAMSSAVASGTPTIRLISGSS